MSITWRDRWLTPFAPLRRRNYRLQWLGISISLAGDSFQIVALSGLALDLTKSTGAWGTLLLVQAVPQTLLMLVGGLLVDRFRARTVLMVTTAAQAVLVALLAALTASGALAHWHLYVYAAAFGTLLGFYSPAVFPLTPETVPPDEVQQANALGEGTGSLAGFVAPPLAGLLVATAGSAAAFALDSLSFVVAATCLSLVRLPPRAAAAPAEVSEAQAERESLLSRLGGGIAAARRDPVLGICLCVAAVLSFGTGLTYVVGLPALAKLELGAGDPGVGVLYGAFGAGALSGTFGAALLARVPRPGALASLVLVGYGLFLAAAGLSPTLWAAAACVAAAGICNATGGIVLLTMVQTRAPTAALGRVMALITLAIFGVTPIAYATAGLIGDAVGPRTLIVAGGALAATAGALALSSRPLRTVSPRTTI